MSLNLRIILSATFVLAIFITLTAAALDQAFFKSTKAALGDQLTSQLYALMAAAEVNNSQIDMPSNELDALLGLPSSGVYAHITNQAGKILWQSSSVLAAISPPPVSLHPGKKQFTRLRFENRDFYRYAYGVKWAGDKGAMLLTFNIATDLQTFNKQIAEYRSTLWGWLLAMAVLLLATQAIILRWGLSPLRKVRAELNAIEAGHQELIKNNYPKEINYLTRNINVLLKHEREQKTRYRHGLGDLAHSLKTPLAILQNGLNDVSVDNNDSMQEQISRMNSIVEYQLQRAATAGASSMMVAIDVKLIIDRIIESLQKVYREKNIQINMSSHESLFFQCEEGDIMELLGNLIDNAFKWAQQRIDISAEIHNKKISICIMDDGPGINEEQAERLMQRGVRADQSVAGHGIGLSIVCNIIDAYRGELSIGKSAAGGAKVCLIL